MARRLRKTLHEAIADPSCRCSGQRIMNDGTGGAAEDNKKYARGVPRAIRLEAAPTLFFFLCCTRCRCHGSFFFFLATCRPVHEAERMQTFLAKPVNVFAAVGSRAWSACELICAWLCTSGIMRLSI